MQKDIMQAAQSFKEEFGGFSHEMSMKHFERQREMYEIEYADFLAHYEREECYLCGKPFKTRARSRTFFNQSMRI